jgi:hypothetical protein
VPRAPAYPATASKLRVHQVIVQDRNAHQQDVRISNQKGPARKPTPSSRQSLKVELIKYEENKAGK